MFFTFSTCRYTSNHLSCVGRNVVGRAITRVIWVNPERCSSCFIKILFKKTLEANLITVSMNSVLFTNIREWLICYLLCYLIAVTWFKPKFILFKGNALNHCMVWILLKYYFISFGIKPNCAIWRGSNQKFPTLLTDLHSFSHINVKILRETLIWKESKPFSVITGQVGSTLPSFKVLMAALKPLLLHFY